MWSNFYSAPVTVGMCCRCPYFAYCSMNSYNQYYGGIGERPKDKKKHDRDVNFYYRQREFTIEELAQYDGSGGKPAYVAVNGTVYDLSMNPAWGGGSHFGLIAGKDLSEEFKSCHGMSSILQTLPKVGVLK